MVAFALPRPDVAALTQRLAEVWAQIKARAAQVNPHVAAAGALTALGLGVMASIAFFGDPSLANARVERALAAQTAVNAGLRDAPAPAGPPGLDDRHGPEPSLPGVEDLDGHAAQPKTHDSSDAHPGPPDDHAASPDPSPGPVTITRPEPPANTDALAPAPIAGLHAGGVGGRLPAIDPNGLTPAAAYARPFAPDDRPAIALMIGGLGLSDDVTQAAIDTLPPQVTLAFVPYVDDLQRWIDTARAAGHEVVLELPMEPFDYPNNDPGPYTLLAEADPAENARRLDWLMARATGYFGVTNYMGARFIASERAAAPFTRTLADRGVALINDGSGARSVIERLTQRDGVRYGAANRAIDIQPAGAAIDDRLLELEALAIQNGSAIGIGAAYPVTIDQVRAWAETLELKGYALAPVSALAQTAEAPAAPSGAAPQTRAAPSFTRVDAAFGANAADADEAKGKSSGGKGKGGH